MALVAMTTIARATGAHRGAWSGTALRRRKPPPPHRANPPPHPLKPTGAEAGDAARRRARRSMAGGRACTTCRVAPASWCISRRCPRGPNQKQLVAFSAVSYRDKGASKPAVGTMRLEADTSVAVDDRLVQFKKLRITEANFQTLDKEQVREVVATIEKAIPADAADDRPRPRAGQSSTRARSCRRTSKASKPIRRRSSSAPRRP